MIVSYPSNNDESNAIKAILKAMKVKFEIKEEISEPSREDVISNIKQGFNEMKLIKEGKLKTTSLNNFIDEL